MAVQLTDAIIQILGSDREPYGTPNPFGNPTQRYYIEGSTYDIKNFLKSFGCRWVPDEKRWKVPDKDTFEYLQNLQASSDVYDITRLKFICEKM